MYKQRGETIIEVIVAVVISVMVLTAVFLLLNRAIDTNVNVRDRVIALNIAREGVEAVRNIRDTNWLKYAGDRRGKWLCLDAVGANSCSGGASSILTDGDYTIEYSGTPNNRYYLMKQTLGGLDLETASAAINDQYRLYTDSTTSRFTHSASGNTPTRFYREVEIKVFSGSDTVPNCTSNDYCKESKAKILVTVQWKDGDTVRSSKIEHHLYDFYERDSY